MPNAVAGVAFQQNAETVCLIIKNAVTAIVIVQNADTLSVVYKLLC
jgi:hypothetical protein